MTTAQMNDPERDGGAAVGIPVDRTVRLPAQAYRTLMVDPPWLYTYETRKTEVPGTGWHGAGEKHYPTMTREQLLALRVADLAADDAVCWLWVVNPLLAQGMELLAAWGFQYKGLVTWVKTTTTHPIRPSIGNGYWLRGATEHMMLGTRGKPKPLVKNQATWFMAPPGAHSAKPEEAYAIAERYFDGPRIELFSRELSPMFPKRAGWDVWGNEVQSDVELAA